MDPTSGHVHLETGKRMSVLSQNPYVWWTYRMETVIMGNKTLYSIKKVDELYLDYNDKMQIE
jgi:hypothetical protein